MDEIASIRVEDVPSDVPLVEALHDDDLGRRGGVGLAGRQRLVVGPNCGLTLDIALGLLHRVGVIEDLDIAAAS